MPRHPQVPQWLAQHDGRRDHIYRPGSISRPQGSMQSRPCVGPGHQRLLIQVPICSSSSLCFRCLHGHYDGRLGTADRVDGVLAEVEIDSGTCDLINCRRSTETSRGIQLLQHALPTFLVPPSLEFSQKSSGEACQAQLTSPAGVSQRRLYSCDLSVPDPSGQYHILPQSCRQLTRSHSAPTVNPCSPMERSMGGAAAELVVPPRGSIGQ